MVTAGGKRKASALQCPSLRILGQPHAQPANGWELWAWQSYAWLPSWQTHAN